MKTCVIVNPNAGTAAQWEALEEEVQQLGFVCLRTAQEGDGRMLARQALDDGFGRVVAAGGDGTIHEVAVGLLEHGADAVLGILPLGTGNDLARTLGIDDDPKEALAAVRQARIERIDVIHVAAGQKTTYAINAVSGGFSGQVDEALTPDLKKTWGPLAYLVGAVRVLPDLHGYETCITIDGEDEARLSVLNIIAANGRTIGGGKRVAPVADPQDGLLDLVLVEMGDVLDMADMSARLLAGTLLESPNVVHRRARSVTLASRPGMWIGVDGELWTQEPVACTVEPAALQVIVGPQFNEKMKSAELEERG